MIDFFNHITGYVVMILEMSFGVLKTLQQSR